MKVFLGLALLLGFIGGAKATDWQWEGGDSIFLAYVNNSAGNSFGQLCSTDEGNCIYMLYLDIICSDGAKFPALINSNIGSYGIHLTCAGSFKDGYLFTLTDFDDADKVAREADSVGFAMSLESGKFSVNRFDLAGSAAVIDKMIGAASRAYNSLHEGEALKEKDAEEI